MRPLVNIILAASLAVILTGCAKNLHTKEAVQEALLKHLSTVSGLDVKAMKIEISGVAFREKEADATARFTPNGMDPSQGMSMTYTLELKDGAWAVKSKRGGMGGHSGGSAEPPPAAAPIMPPGHPAVPEGGKK